MSPGCKVLSASRAGTVLSVLPGGLALAASWIRLAQWEQAWDALWAYAALSPGWGDTRTAGRLVRAVAKWVQVRLCQRFRRLMAGGKPLKVKAYSGRFGEPRPSPSLCF
jgi:hypothetical protein